MFQDPVASNWKQVQNMYLLGCQSDSYKSYNYNHFIYYTKTVVQPPAQNNHNWIEKFMKTILKRVLEESGNKHMEYRWTKEITWDANLLTDLRSGLPILCMKNQDCPKCKSNRNGFCLRQTLKAWTIPLGIKGIKQFYNFTIYLFSSSATSPALCISWTVFCSTITFVHGTS